MSNLTGKLYDEIYDFHGNVVSYKVNPEQLKKILRSCKNVCK